jgi:hypothetical protein
MQLFRSPQQPYFSLPFWIGVFALPIGVESPRLRKFPRRRFRKPLRIEVFYHPNGHGRLFLYCRCVFIHSGDCTSSSASQNNDWHLIHN